jgi:hypothetical protein
MVRNLVVCCDGTGNEYGTENSNVVKLYWALSAHEQQTGYYHPGLGTAGARNALTAAGKWWTKVRGLAFGYGFSDNIADVYEFLMREYTPGDKIYIFGFSRGAYTARALCGLLHMCGLLTRGNEALIPYALRLYKSNSSPERFKVAKGFRDTFSIECKPYFLGLWDTVSSIGWILDPIFNGQGHLPFTAQLPDVSIIRHAVSIDERRAFFRQNLIAESAGTPQNLKQVWFAGVHSDVGGSYPDAESGLSQTALRWMLCEAATAGVALDPQKFNDILGGMFPNVPPNHLGKLHQSLKGFWLLGEIWPKLHYRKVGTAWKRGIHINLGRRRTIPPGAHIHQSVLDRMRDDAHYQPKLPAGYIPEPPSNGELVPRPVAPLQPSPVASKLPLLKRPSVVTVLAALVLLGVCGAVIAVFTIHNSLEVPDIKRPGNVVYLPQNWSDEQRQTYYHTAQGSELLPYAWFLALEQPRFSITGAPLFKEDSYMQGFGFIPDKNYAQNPDSLPVGFARDDRFVDPYTGQRNAVLGITCAACHTGELFYQDKAIRIDAGPSLIELQKFTEALGLAVTWTYYDPLRFRRFAHAILGPDPSSADEGILRKALKYYLDTSFTDFKSTLHLFPTPEGYGRTDALARIGNFVFGTELSNRKNLKVADGPVNYPPVWDTSWFDWVQYNGSIQQPMGRNVGEALGVRARLNMIGYPGTQFQNTIRVENINSLEKLLGGEAPGKGVWSPKWPAEIFGKIDDAKALQGKALYNSLCIGCHKPPMLSEEGQKSEFWTTNTDSAGRQFFKVTLVDLPVIGTDPKEARNFAERKADSGPVGKGTISAADGLKYITQRIIDQAYSDLNLSPEQRQAWDGYRGNSVLAPLKYKARPHNGIWATPPYLHNGSVPSLYALLSPVSERPKVFYLGNKQYDPVKLGLNTEPLKGASEFRTSLPGNSNAGHEFNDGPKGNGIIGRKLSEEERMQIIEYLKTL